MKETTNVFTIESISMQQIPQEYNIKLECILKSKLEFKCSVNGMTAKIIEIESKGTAYNEEDAARKAIQNLLDGKSYFSNKVFGNEIKSLLSNKIHYLEIHLPPPAKQFFEDLFDNSKWDIPNRYIE